MYVELPNTIEGLIHVANLYDDRYYYNENTHEMVGSDLGKVYKLGQSIRVRVLDADKENATIDFVPAAIWGISQRREERYGSRIHKTDCKQQKSIS
mgnify:CR=1 FL=1